MSASMVRPDMLRLRFRWGFSATSRGIRLCLLAQATAADTLYQQVEHPATSGIMH